MVLGHLTTSQDDYAALDAATLDVVDIAEDGQLSLGVPGEQMPLDGLAPNPKEER